MLAYLGALWTARLATRGERGADAVEYALMVAGVAVACIVAFEALAATLRGVFEATNSNVESCGGCSAP